jgi:hypothetical protein
MRGPVASIWAVAFDGVDGPASRVCWSEVGAITAEYIDPLPAGLVGVLGDDVRDVGGAAAGHGDVRRRGPGVFADGDVSAPDGAALGAVDGRGIGEFDEPGRVVGRDLSFPATATQEEAAVLPDAGDSPGLAVGDLEIGIVASGRDPVGP